MKFRRGRAPPPPPPQLRLWTLPKIVFFGSAPPPPSPNCAPEGYQKSDFAFIDVWPAPRGEMVIGKRRAHRIRLYIICIVLTTGPAYNWRLGEGRGGSIKHIFSEISYRVVYKFGLVNLQLQLPISNLLVTPYIIPHNFSMILLFF